MKTYTVSWILDSYKGNSLTKREALALIGDRVEVCKSDESMIQKELRGDNYDRWRHSTKPHMPQSVNKFLPNYVDVDKLDVEVRKDVKSHKR